MLPLGKKKRISKLLLSKNMNEAQKKLLKALVKSLNDAREHVVFAQSGRGLSFVVQEENKLPEVYFIKLRPEDDNDGIQRFVYKARLQK